MKLSFGLLLFALAIPAVQALNILDLFNPAWYISQLVFLIVKVAFVDVDGTVCVAVEAAFEGVSGETGILSCTCASEVGVTFVVPSHVTATATCSVVGANTFEIGDQTPPNTPAAVSGGTLTAEVQADFSDLLGGNYKSFKVNSIDACWTTDGGSVCPTYTGSLTVDPPAINIDKCSIGTGNGEDNQDQCKCDICSTNQEVSYSCSGRTKIEDTCVNPTLITGLV